MVKPQNTFVRFEQQKKILLQVLDVARAIERMQEGLNAVLFLGEPATKLPPEIRQFFKGISNRLKQQPKEKIIHYINELDELIHKDLELVIQHAHKDYDSANAHELTAETLSLLDNFRRRAQTSISLRMLLQKRGITAPTIRFQAPLEDIRSRVSELETKDQLQRNKAVHHMREMKHDLELMPENAGYDETMKETINGVIKGLEKDIKAVSSGQSIDELPFPFEEIQEEDQWRAPVFEHPADSITKPMDKEIIGENDTDIDIDIDIDQGVTEDTPQKSGFFNRLKRWLLTPWNVSWKDIDKNK